MGRCEAGGHLGALYGVAAVRALPLPIDAFHKYLELCKEPEVWSLLGNLTRGGTGIGACAQCCAVCSSVARITKEKGRGTAQRTRAESCTL